MHNIDTINGKVLIFTDLHIGLKSASKTRLAICVKVIKEIVNYIKEHNIKYVIFCGDWNHVRVSTENNVLNVSYNLMKALAKYATVYLLNGNHDLYMKNSVEISSLIIFKDIKNVKIIDNVQLISINGNSSLLVPWLGNIEQFEPETFDMIFGHFDISHKYLIKSYIEEHTIQSEVSDTIKQQINNDLLIKTTGSTSDNSGDYVGNFVDIVKKTGTVFSGHIHKHREFLAKGRKFIMIGDPYQQNLGEIDYQCGFYVINENNTYDFHEINGIPKHISLRMSNVVKNYETFDFSIVKGQILHKIYDIDVDRIIDAKISQKINDWKPYEELLPDYEVDLQLTANFKLQNESVELIKKSKLEYVKNYIENIDKNILTEQNINSEILYKTLEDYYNLVIDEK